MKRDKDKIRGPDTSRLPNHNSPPSTKLKIRYWYDIYSSSLVRTIQASVVRSQKSETTRIYEKIVHFQKFDAKNKIPYNYK
jgi:hypothetical protein